MRELGIDADTVNFGVHIVSSKEIHELNLKHRGKDKPTDVLSFPTLNIAAGQIPTRDAFPLDYNPETGRIELGDIVVNEDEKNRDFLIQHGLMHLLGHHHEEDDE